MALLHEKKIKSAALKQIAEKMLIAARTAPKGRGQDHLSLAIAEEEEIRRISEKMKEIGERTGAQYFIRDALNILEAPVIVLLGSEIATLGLVNCGNCGFADCSEKEKHPEIPCAFNTGDLGIAIGSAVSIAMDHRADNRIMFTIGQAVLELGLFEPEVRIIYGIPLSATSKNPFFDRKS